MKISVFPFLAVVLLAAGLLFDTGCSSTDDRILAIIGADTLDVSLYSRYCERLHGKVPDSMAQREDLLTRLVDFKVKAKEAQALGLEKDTALQSEIREFSDDLSVSFLLEDQLVEPGIRELFTMRKEELRASHILVKFRKDFRGAIDTVSTRDEAEKLFQEV